MNNIVSIMGYHGTCSKFKESIENNGLDPAKVKYRENHWLGQGVYFFEDYSQAEWWANDTSGKPYNAGSFPMIYKSNIEAESNKVLNLDDNNEVDKFFSCILRYISEIESDLRGRYPIFTPENFRAVYFDYYKIQNNISVIIYTFPKDSVKYASLRNWKDLKIQKDLAKALGIYYGEKQICVSKKECITSSVLVYDGEDEVI